MPIRRVIRMGQRRQRARADGKIDAIKGEEENEEDCERKRIVIDRKNRRSRNNLNTSRKSKKSTLVCWNSKLEKKRHIKLSDMTEEERDSIWYTESDTKIILAMAKITVKMMMRNEPCDDIDYCTRGLEGKTASGAKRRSKTKSVVRKAVLLEQKRQYLDGRNDPTKLANISFNCTRDNGDKARENGIKDELDISDYINDTRERMKYYNVSTKRRITITTAI